MSTIPNIYSAQTPIGQSLQNIAQIMVSAAPPPVSPADAARADYYGAQTDLTRQELERNRAIYGAQGQLASLFDQFQPQTVAAPGPQPIVRGPATTTVAPNYTGLAGEFGSIGAGAGMDPDDIAKWWRYAAATNGAPDSVLAQAFLANGDAISPDDAFSLPGQQGIADRNAGYSLNETLADRAATPLTRSQIEGSLLARAFDTMNPRDQGTVLGIYSTPSMELLTGGGGELISVDRNDPLGVAGAVPGPDEDGSLSALFGVTPLGGSETTATQQNLEAEAASLGISVSELQFVSNINERIRADGAGINIARITPEEKAAYEAIFAKMQSAVSSQPLPEGFSVVEP